MKYRIRFYNAFGDECEQFFYANTIGDYLLTMMGFRRSIPEVIDICQVTE